MSNQENQRACLGVHLASQGVWKAIQGPWGSSKGSGRPYRGAGRPFRGSQRQFKRSGMPFRGSQMSSSSGFGGYRVTKRVWKEVWVSRSTSLHIMTWKEVWVTSNLHCIPPPPNLTYFLLAENRTLIVEPMDEQMFHFIIGNLTW